MSKSLSILSFAAALALAGTAMAQDTAADTDTTADAAEDSAVTDDTATDSATDSAPAEDAAADETPTDDAATDGAAAADADDATDGVTLDTGTEVAPEEPGIYVKETFGDWSMRCFRNENGEDPCQLYQLLREDGGNPVAEFSVFRIKGQAPAVAGATAIVPLVTLLTEELKMSVDNGNAKSYPYRVCTESGCVAQMGFTAEDIAAFKKGKGAQIVIVPAQAPDQQVKIKVSLMGFTAGYEAIGALTE